MAKFDTDDFTARQEVLLFVMSHKEIFPELTQVMSKTISPLHCIGWRWCFNLEKLRKSPTTSVPPPPPPPPSPH